MELDFTKMQGLGNDFVVLNGLDRKIELTTDQIRRIADRRFGVGCDQVLLISPPANGAADVRYRVFNADGGEVEQCGNGARCVADYLYHNGIVDKAVIHAECLGGSVTLAIAGEGMVRVDMGVPRFEPEHVPVLARERSLTYAVDLPGGEVRVYALSMGNPHAVLEVDDVDGADVENLGPQLQKHGLFPQSVNAGFMQIVDRRHIWLRVYERGVGETLACGSGACAAAVAGIIAGKLDNKVDVGLKGGHLTIEWEGEGSSVWMTGPAVTVYQGRIEI